MGANSKIEWCHHTFNPWRGCTKVSEGCKHCYAETLSKRNPKVLGMWGPQGTRVMASEAMWRQPLKWNEEARAAGELRRVFCASLADVFEGPETCTPEAYQVIRAARVRLFETIFKTEWLDWLLLTKRPENIGTALCEVCEDLQHGETYRFLSDWICEDFMPANIWLGTSVENQAAADNRIPELLNVPAKVRFLSCEPLLGPVQITNVSGWAHPDKVSWWGEPILGPKGIHWVIAGGESGPNARPMHPEWARSLRDQCQSAGVAFHFKQWGEWAPIDQPWEQDSPLPLAANERWLNLAGGMGFHGDKVWRMARVGKAAAGRLLDGREWDEVPA